MKKIQTLFVRDECTRLVTDRIQSGCEWVQAGEGVATKKYDGTCCLVRGGRLFKRHEVKPGGKVPPDFEPAGEVDEITGKVQGWVPVGDGPEDRWHREAFAEPLKWTGWTAFMVSSGFAERPDWADGTYELCGPKVQGNPEQFESHHLVPHGYGQLIAFPRTFAEIRAAFADMFWTSEGVVWWRSGNQDCDKVKIKVRDFGLKRVPISKHLADRAKGVTDGR